MKSTSAAPTVKGFFEKATSSIQNVVSDPASRKCVIIHPVLDFDVKSGAIATRSADQILTYVEPETLEVQWIWILTLMPTIFQRLNT